MSLYKKQYKVNRDNTSDLEIPEIVLHNDENLVLTGRIAAVDDNPALQAANIARFGKDQPGRRTKRKEEEKRLEVMIREHYPEHVFTGWNIVDEQGNPVPYSVAECKKLMEELSPYACSDILVHFTEPSNFHDVLTKADGEDLGNESGK